MKFGDFEKFTGIEVMPAHMRGYSFSVDLGTPKPHEERMILTLSFVCVNRMLLDTKQIIKYNLPR